jgi:hypothetical protein
MGRGRNGPVSTERRVHEFDSQAWVGWCCGGCCPGWWHGWGTVCVWYCRRPDDPYRSGYDRDCSGCEWVDVVDSG